MIFSERRETHALRLLEALLFAASEPLDERELARRLPDGADVNGLLAKLTADYAARGVHLVQAGRTWAFQTAPDLAPLLARDRQVDRKLTRAAMETLAIMAYHQPVTRGEIEAIRGVQVSKGTLDALFDLGWIAPRGRRETPGRPVTWVTTDAFLRHFGLATLADLPNAHELKAAGLLDARPAIAILRPDAGDAPPTPEPAEPLDPEG